MQGLVRQAIRMMLDQFTREHRARCAIEALDRRFD